MVNLVWGSVAKEKGGKVVVWAICKSKEVLGQIPESFCKTKFKGEVETF